MPLLLHEIGHLILYLSIVFIWMVAFKQRFSWKLLALGLTITLFIDLDHLFDYILTYGITINLPLMLSGQYFDTGGKIFVPLHSWELVLVLLAGWVITRLKNQQSLSRALFVSFIALCVHLSFDVLYYGFNPLVYFVTYRWLHGFSMGVFTGNL